MYSNSTISTKVVVPTAIGTMATAMNTVPAEKDALPKSLAAGPTATAEMSTTSS